ncbi:ADP-ribosylarginine hydrolase Tri1 [Cupriavidus laharis]|uniref:ADP-ribosylarginine hydrolase Tri1 n=1 Tax=Cupriavidus laharis TaxID=151654 RepID=A0ABM8WY87_9BURK|nr:ADP-ribosylglycohydrolase family protein [Cupriavidus laharis]CAG9172540.1 ADP-ribosylarginine hydrolase Tri1 [Cupriavidus laharis]
MSHDGFLGLAQQHPAHATLGGLVGLLVGDALGVPYEFHSAAQLPARESIEMQPPAGFHRAHSGVPAGTWSDDGAQALCLLATLVEHGKLSLVDFADRLLLWLDRGYLAIDGRVFDVGIQTADALDNLRDGASPRESGGRDVMDNGNGSLMRCLPLALLHAGTDSALVREAHLQSLPTHAHPRSQVACAYYCLVARGYLGGLADPWASADSRLETVYTALPDAQGRGEFLRELDVLRGFPTHDVPRGTGYVLDTLWSARRALEESTFEDAVRTAVLFGNDTDTTACVAGGLAGIRFGLGGIPKRWLEQLRGYDVVEPLISALAVEAPEIGRRSI